MKKILFLLLGVLVFQSGFFSAADAQVEQVRIKVNGLACPFCAYGLEKKLKKLDGVGKVTISLNEGLAVLNNKDGLSIPVDNLEKIVKDAGFSATEIAITVRGTVTKSGDSYVLDVADSEVEFLLENNEILKNLASQAGNAIRSVKAKGGLVRKGGASGRGHMSLRLHGFEFE